MIGELFIKSTYAIYKFIPLLMPTSLQIWLYPCHGCNILLSLRNLGQSSRNLKKYTLETFSKKTKTKKIDQLFFKVVPTPFLNKVQL